jgi:N-acetyl-gamma-glutamyl-phosphate reductase
VRKILVGIIGGTGYTGVELLRLLVNHPGVEVKLITSRAEAGKSVSSLFPNLRGHLDLDFSDPQTANYSECDVVFSATPNGIAMQHARELTESGIRLIDLAADFRIKDIDVWEQWYGMQHACPELVADSVYGLPEINRSVIANAAIVANPGCYPTAVALGFLPLLSQKLVRQDSLIANSVSGVTGAGRSASVANLFSEVSDSFKAYSVTGHRHQPEIKQTLSAVAQAEVGLTFIPHLVPMLRGIHATLYADLLQTSLDVEALHEVFVSYYLKEPFVDVMPLGAHPETRSVKSSNTCRIAIHKESGNNKLVVLSVIDNLTKGASGQAVQNMNIMFSLPENAGLQAAALIP